MIIININVFYNQDKRVGNMSQEYEDIAGGMSYRTMRGIEFSDISEYLDGFDETSKKEIFKKNKNYYIASANKTIERLELAKTRLLTSELSIKTIEMIIDKICDAFGCLEKLKIEIENARFGNEILKKVWYKRWHALKLLPSAAEGILIGELIDRKIKILNRDADESGNELIQEVVNHNNKAKSIFLKLLDLDESTDFKDAEESRLNGYGELILAHDKLGNIELK